MDLKWCTMWGQMQNIPARALSQGPSPPKHLSALLALAARAAHQSYLRALGVGAWSKLSPQLLEAFLLLLPTYLKKKLSEILFLQPKRSQLHTIACSEVWRGTQKLWILTTCIITFGLLLKQRKSPGDSWRRIAMGSCHRGQHSNICQFLLFALLAHSKRCSEDQSLQTGCFPPKGKPTGLVPQLNLSQVVVSGDAGGKFGRVLVLP